MIRRKGREKGIATIEFALVAFFLLLITFGAIDFGEAWFKSNSVQTAVRTAAVNGFDKGDNYAHDYHVIRSLMLELEEAGVDNVERITVFDPNATRWRTKDACTPKSHLDIDGIHGECVSYGGAFLEGFVTGDGLAAFHAGPGQCVNDAPGKPRKGSPDAIFCAGEDRFGDPVKGSTLYTEFVGRDSETIRFREIGVKVWVKQEALTGFFPFFQNYTIEKESVAGEFQR